MLNVEPIELYHFLKSKNIEIFFHANTVTTSCTLIKQKGLLSRGVFERNGLDMTPQSSDDCDKLFEVWNDIFFDILDLHGYFPRQNLYGPVCFVLSNKFLLDEKLPNICITKDNPIYWDLSMDDKEKYYSSVDEYMRDYDYNIKTKQIQKRMFTIHNTQKRIPFKKYLIKIILDNPKVKLNDLSLYKHSKKRLLEALEIAGFKQDLLKERICHNCYCQYNYLNQVDSEELEKLFL